MTRALEKTFGTDGGGNAAAGRIRRVTHPSARAAAA